LAVVVLADISKGDLAGLAHEVLDILRAAEDTERSPVIKRRRTRGGREGGLGTIERQDRQIVAVLEYRQSRVHRQSSTTEDQQQKEQQQDIPQKEEDRAVGRTTTKRKRNNENTWMAE
jgi:molybdenum-dependent DNA-binding transcriptional regulator ModE